MRYNVYLNGTPYAYDLYWYTNSGTVCGSEIYTESYTEWGESGKLDNINVFTSGRLWSQQNAYSWPDCYMVQENSPTFGVFDVNYYRWHSNRRI